MAKKKPTNVPVQGAIARCPRAASTVELTARLQRAAHQPPATVDTRSVLVGTSGVSVAWPDFVTWIVTQLGYLRLTLKTIRQCEVPLFPIQPTPYTGFSRLA